MWFLDFVTVFKESYNCQTSHNLGRNQLPKPLLLPLASNLAYFYGSHIDGFVFVKQISLGLARTLQNTKIL